MSEFSTDRSAIERRKASTLDPRRLAPHRPAERLAARGRGQLLGRETEKVSVQSLRGRARRAAGSFGRLDFPRDPSDRYETPVEAVELLLRHEKFVGACWDSSCGRGNILQGLSDGLPTHQLVVGSDLQQATMKPSLRKRRSSVIFWPGLPRRQGDAGRLPQHRNQPSVQGLR